VTHDLVIIGGGQSGLASAYAARRQGLRPLLLTTSAEPVGSWPDYYNSLTLFSPARYSELPGRRFEGDRDRYPTRLEVIDYLRAYAAGLDAYIRCGERVERVSRDDAGLRVETATGLQVHARFVIAATGSYLSPHRPRLPGADDFAGTTIHASDYRDPAGYAGQRIVVVGGGNTAVQIAAELARTARVTLATRSSLKFTPQRPLGRDLHWWLTRSGVDGAPIGRWLRGKTTPVLDDGRYGAALAAGRPDHRPMFDRLEADHVVWADGSREPLDTLILATGYRPHLPYLAGTGALGADDHPLHRAGLSTTVAGLGYVGLEYQRSIASATVRGVGRDAQRVVAQLLAEPGAERRQAAWHVVRGRCCPAVAR
jgi:putative flavoprotein involved in K+ transport